MKRAHLIVPFAALSLPAFALPGGADAKQAKGAG